MKKQIIQPERKSERILIRIEKSTLDKAEAISLKRKVERSTVIRRLIEIGLEHAE